MRTAPTWLTVLLLTGCSGGPKVDDERDVCDDYIDCATTAEPGSATRLLTEFGEDSICWSNADSAEVCAESCRVALDRCEAPIDPDSEVEDDTEPVDTGDGGDTGTHDSPQDILVQTVDLTCTSGGADVVVEYDGWAEEVTVDTRITSGGNGSASYVLPNSANVAACPDQTCDSWEYTIPDSDLAAPCGTFTRANDRFTNVAVRVRAEPAYPEDTVECVIFGRGSRAEYGPSCTCAEAWLNPPPSDPCGS